MNILLRGPALAAVLCMAQLHAAPTVLSGIDLRYVDASVRPQDDVYRYLHNGWLNDPAVAPDPGTGNVFARLRAAIQPQLREVIEAQRASRPGSDGRKIADLYASYMDQASIERLGLQPLADELRRVRSLSSRAELPTLFGRWQTLGVSAPYWLSVSPDHRSPDRNVLTIHQDGLGLPDRDYYLHKEARLDAALAKYRLHVEQMLRLAGHDDPAAGAAAVMDIETAIAQAQWSRSANRDPLSTYNKVAVAQLPAGYDWRMALGAAGVPAVKEVIVAQPDYLRDFAALLERYDLASWKSYCEWQLLRRAAPYLPPAFADAHFAMFSTVLRGIPAAPQRWQVGVNEVQRVMGEGVGRLYVTKYFSPQDKLRVQAMVLRLRDAYHDGIDRLEWLDPATRVIAQQRLATMTVKVGYPDRWRDYSLLTIAPDALLANMLRASSFELRADMVRLSQPVDRGAWGMTPQTANVYFNPVANEIVFPAAMMQPPFFNPQADDAANYGALGASIGHVIAYSFDEQGAQYDNSGALHDWWSHADHQRFRQLTAPLIRQYDSYSPLPGLRVNGTMTQGANLADSVGLTIAYRAYHAALQGKPAPVIDGLSGDQRFYLGYAQMWREKLTPDRMTVVVRTDPHAPAEFRVNGVLINQPGFYEAFDVKPGDKMYVAPEQRVKLW